MNVNVSRSVQYQMDGPWQPAWKDAMNSALLGYVFYKEEEKSVEDRRVKYIFIDFYTSL